MITASKMDAANVDAVLKRDAELVAANEALSGLVDWDGPGAVENARELYEAVAAQAEEHASAERGLRAELEARGACLQAEMVKLSQAQTSLDYAGVRRADLERELETANAELYTLRGLGTAAAERTVAMRNLLGPRVSSFAEEILTVAGLIGAVEQCRLLLETIVQDESIGADAELRTRAAKVLRVVIEQAIEPRCPSGPGAPRSEPA